MVKRYGNLWERVVSIENITQAYHESRKGKTSKPGVRQVDEDPSTYISEIQRLLVNKEYRIFPVESRGVDFVGYRTFHDFCLVRTKNKNKMKRAMRRLEAKLDAGHDLDEHDLGCLASWSGILGWCDSWRLAKKTTRRVKRKQEARNWMKSPQHRTRVPSSS